MLILLILALCCGPGHSSSLRRPLWYHPYPETWQTARDVCKSEHQGDLLTVLSQDELDIIDMSSYDAWIGLRGHEDHFHWDDSGDKHAPDNWAPGPGKECGLTSFQKDSPRAAECTHRHFFFCPSSSSSDEFVPKTLSYSDAKDHCRSHVSTFPGESSLNFHGSPLYERHDFPVWVGLDSSSVPTDPAPGSCVSMGSVSKSMSVHSCSDAFPFVCSKPNLVLLQELLSWEQAVAQCRKLSSSSSFRLLSVDQSHMDTIKNVLCFAQNNKVWVGLRFLAGSWFWADGVPLTSVPSLPPCPDPTVACGALDPSSGSDPEVVTVDCSERLYPLCYAPPL